MSEISQPTEPTPGGTGATAILPWLGAAMRRSDIALALGVVAILVVLVLPLPSWLLDFSLAISFSFAVLVLMT